MSGTVPGKFRANPAGKKPRLYGYYLQDREWDSLMTGQVLYGLMNVPYWDFKCTNVHTSRFSIPTFIYCKIQY